MPSGTSFSDSESDSHYIVRISTLFDTNSDQEQEPEAEKKEPPIVYDTQALKNYIASCVTDPNKHSRFKTAEWLMSQLNNIRLIRVLHASFREHAPESELYKALDTICPYKQKRYSANFHADANINKISLTLAKQLLKLETRYAYKHGTPTEKLRIDAQIYLLHTTLTFIYDNNFISFASKNLEAQVKEKIQATLKQLHIPTKIFQYSDGTASKKLFALITSETTQQSMAAKEIQELSYNPYMFFFKPQLKNNSDSKISLFYDHKLSPKHSRIKTADWLEEKLQNMKGQSTADLINLLFQTYLTLHQQSKRSHLLQVIRHNLINLAGLDPAKAYSFKQLIQQMQTLGYETESKQNLLLKILFKQLHSIETNSSYKKLSSSKHNELETEIADLHKAIDCVLSGEMPSEENVACKINAGLEKIGEAGQGLKVLHL